MLPGESFRDLGPRRARVALQQRVAAHDEPAGADPTLEPAFHPERTLDGVQALDPGPLEIPATVSDLLPAAQARAENRAAVDRLAVDQHGARAALGAVTAEVGDVQIELLRRGRPQRLAYVDDDTCCTLSMSSVTGACARAGCSRRRPPRVPRRRPCGRGRRTRRRGRAVRRLHRQARLTTAAQARSVAF